MKNALLGFFLFMAFQEGEVEKAAGPDYRVQGEYAGKVKLGAQVIAEGKGQFSAVLYPGGLPGAGWDGKTRIQVAGKAEGAKLRLSGSQWSFEVGGGKLVGKGPDGVLFSLSRWIRQGPTLGQSPPKGALVLFDGSNADAWENGKRVEGNLLNWGVTSKRAFRDFKLHLEFRLPWMPEARGQARGNSGLYLQGRYECQILDSFGLEGADNECGGFYQVAKPAVNLCLPPLQWQTYDVEFRAAKYDAAGKKLALARATVIHNGVKIHENTEFKGPTGGGAEERDAPGPIHLQDHGDPVVYRNIWIQELR